MAGQLTALAARARSKSERSLEVSMRAMVYRGPYRVRVEEKEIRRSSIPTMRSFE